MAELALTVPFLYIQKRLDAYLTEALEGRWSRSQIKHALDEGRIAVNGVPAKPRTLVKEGDRITGLLTDPGPQALVPEDLPVSVLYEDASFLVVDKPAGMVVHPGAGRKTGTLVHALLGRGGALSDVGGAHRPGVVHRLDKETSGLILIARDNRAHRALQTQFQERSLEKTYVALVKGAVEFEEGRIDAPLGRHPSVRTKRAVSRGADAREALTHYRVARRFRHATLLEVRIVTGRTHQIRVHLAHLGHPVAGDALYAGAPQGARLGLHAWKLSLDHPRTGERLTFESPWPADFRALVERAEQGGPV